MSNPACATGDATPSLKGKFPFRLGTTSYILPDEILPNVRWLAPQIDDIELVLFESDTLSNIPTPSFVAELKAIALDQAITYTIHLPLDIVLGHPDPAVRAQSLEICLRLADRVEPLSPFAYIVHCTGDQRGQVPSEDMRRWLDGHRQSLVTLANRLGPRRLCLETLEYPFDFLLPLIMEIDLGVCLDIGHLMLHQRDVLGHFDRLVERIHVIHAHGIVDGIDHQSLASCDPAVFAALIERLHQPAARPDHVEQDTGVVPLRPLHAAHTAERTAVSRVLTIEIFSQAVFHDSMRVMERFRSHLGRADLTEERKGETDH